MVCKICDETSSIIFRKKILGKYEVAYYQCSSCGFIQTEEPYWLEESYRDPINTEDTGIIKRNLLLAKRTSAVLFWFFDRKGYFLDYGGGYGLFVRIMRDRGFQFYWHDPYTENLFARGFEYDVVQPKNIELITSFECFEHFANPTKEVDAMLSIAPSILLSTETFSHGTPDPDAWRYYYFSHGQHVSLYSTLSLRTLAQKKNLHFYTNGKSFHLLTRYPIHNTTFSLLLKLSLLGMYPLIGLFMKSKTKTDSALIEQRKGRPQEDVS